MNRPVLMGGKSRATISEKLMARIRREFPEFKFTAAARIIRTRAGYWQRSAGAWRWQVEDVRMYPCAGSQSTVKACLAAKRLTKSADMHFGMGTGDYHLDPEGA